MRTAYFVRGEAAPETLDPRYDVVVVQWQSLWNDTVDTLLSYQNAGIAVHVHVPICYTNPDYDTAAHRAIRAVLDEHDAWLLGLDGERVCNPDDIYFIDPRKRRTVSALVDVHRRRFQEAAWIPDGLFLDMIWDRVSWRQEFAGMAQGDRDVLDTAYRCGMYRLAIGLKFQLRKLGFVTAFYGNGNHRCTICDGTVYENFPHSQQVAGVRNLNVALTGPYGQDTWRLFEHGPMLMPTNDDPTKHPGYDIPPFRVVEAVGFATAFCPEDTIVVDNSGYVFDVMARLVQEE